MALPERAHSRRVPPTPEQQSSRSGGGDRGYFLDHARFSDPAPRVALFDLNTHCLARTARRIARYHPEIYRADVLQPIVLDVRRFDSVALNYVVHCLPASWPHKGTVFPHLKAMLNPGGTLFGATLVQGDVPQSAADPLRPSVAGNRTCASRRH